jgi:hypothetical protein
MEMDVGEQRLTELYVCEDDLNDACVVQRNKINNDSKEQACTVLQTQYVQGKEMEKSMVILFDPGSTRSHIRQQILPTGATPRVGRNY